MGHATDDKNFRLPTAIRPRRYTSTLTLDLKARTFAGMQRIEVTISEPSREIILHGIGLQLSHVTFRSQGEATQEPTAIRAAPASETLIITFPEPLPKGDAVLDMDWTGAFTEGLRGLYMAGDVAVTQFEAADARRLFPCFDEPAFKARWALTVRVPPGLTVLSNGAVVSTEQDGELEKLSFAETEVLSSYLVALVVGKLGGTPEEKAAGVPVRTWALPEKARLTGFGQEVALAVLPMLQEYFGLPYAYGKVDQVGIPNFEAGAMENAGLITYREVALLLDLATAPLSLKKRVASVITHELAHQWFGNWVTMVWWDDLWLNEAFATWMGYKMVDRWRPEWRMWLDFDAGTATALALDALRSTHPIRGVVRNANEATESFDAITYEKGGAVLRMIEAYIGETAFRDGIRQYMRDFARSNAVADDLWSALAKASSQPVVEVANAWIQQTGYPLISVRLDDGAVTLSQQRFFSEPDLTSGEQWPVPIMLRFRGPGGTREQRVLLRERELRVLLDGGGEVTWLCANAGNTSFYRVAYDAGALAKLVKHLPELAPSERIALIADQWALVRANKAKIGAFLDLAAGMGSEEDDAVLDMLVSRLGYIEHRLVASEDEPRFHAFVQKLLSEQLAKVGWESRPGEDDRLKLRRAALVRAVGHLGRSPAVLEQARPRVSKVLEGTHAALEPNLLDVAVLMVARSGGKELFEQLQEKAPKEADPATKRRYLSALTTFEDPALAERAYELLLRDIVPTQDMATFIAGLMGNRKAQDRAWKFLQTRWREVLQRMGGAPMLLRRIVESLGHLRERRHLDEVTAFLKANPMEEVPQAIAQTLERLNQDVALRERAMPEVSAWLRQHG